MGFSNYGCHEDARKGQHIDYSQQEAIMQMVGPASMDDLFNGGPGARQITRKNTIATAVGSSAPSRRPAGAIAPPK